MESVTRAHAWGMTRNKGFNDSNISGTTLHMGKCSLAL